jgi:predicted nucleotidyltransferase
MTRVYGARIGAPRIQTSSERVRAAVRGARHDVVSTFGERCVAVYAIGSLARGGFSETVSDIDLAVVLVGPLATTDAASMDVIARSARARDASLPNGISIFWGSIESLNGAVWGGRFPPFDRLDLIDDGLPLHGDDVRSGLVRPQHRELVLAGARFALDTLSTDDRLAQFRDPGLIADRGPVYLTKLILFPARVLSLEHTGLVAGNDESARYYCDTFDGPDAELVGQALHWRSEALPASATIQGLLESGLVPLYERFLDVYVETIEAYGEIHVASRLIRWRNRLSV